MRAIQEKYIDLEQFPHRKDGSISWKDSVGLTVEFFYNKERHTIKILERINRNHLKIKVDNEIVMNVPKGKITNLYFDDMFYRPNYRYNVGDVINGLIVLEQKREIYGKYLSKSYKVRCIKDGYEYVTREYELIDGCGCPVCANLVVLNGVNDIATTNPEVVNLLLDKNDANRYTRGSQKEVMVICPNCGQVKSMTVGNLCNLGYVTCDICSDGISYPNKFARELFAQLSGQYLEYTYEYCPEWANPYIFDNYILLPNRHKIVVEMDGGLHYREFNVNARINDKLKDSLCFKNDVDVIRIDCDYGDVNNRFDYIKSNVIESLGQIFDLSYVNWDKCDAAGISNKMMDVISFYNNNPLVCMNDIANRFHICLDTLYRYLRVGEKYNMCTYVRADPNRLTTTKPVAMYDACGNLVGVFNSARVAAETFPEKHFNKDSMSKYIREEKPYKGYLFKYISREEYLSFNHIIQ